MNALVGSESGCYGRIRIRIFWSDPDEFFLVCRFRIDSTRLRNAGSVCSGLDRIRRLWSDTGSDGLIGFGCFGGIQNRMLWCDSDPNVFVGFESVCFGRIRMKFFSEVGSVSTPSRCATAVLTVPVLIGSGCFGRIRDQMFWLDPDPVGIVGFGSECFGRIRIQIIWFDPNVLVESGCFVGPG